MRKNNKTFTYYDVETETYVTLALSLKDSIKDIDINSFFKFLYSMKLDTGYSSKRTFADKKSTGDLINEFRKILDSDIINLSGLSDTYDMELLENEFQDKDIEDQNRHFNKLAAGATITSFFDLFQINAKENYTDDEINAIVRQTKVRQLSSDDRTSIERLITEISSAKENTKFIYSLAKNNLIKMSQKNQSRNIALAK